MLPIVLGASPPAAAQEDASSASIVFDGARALDHVEAVVAIGPRPAGSPEGEATREYITRQLGALGLSVEAQPFRASTPI